MMVPDEEIVHTSIVDARGDLIKTLHKSTIRLCVIVDRVTMFPFFPLGSPPTFRDTALHEGLYNNRSSYTCTRSLRLVHNLICEHYI